MPRVRLAHLPTPLEPLPHLSRKLNGPRIWIKRDDCTGLALGGNKTRHLEFVLGQALQRGADTLVWGADVQSNNGRQTAAACAKLGLNCHLVLSTMVRPALPQGNLLLDLLLGATVEYTTEPLGEGLWERIRRASRRLEQSGHKVFSVVDPVTLPAASLSYIEAAIELDAQVRSAGLNPAAIYVASGGPTGAGLMAARKLMGLPWQLHNVLPIQ
ncbi:MAG TPA: pyridoxal-phosphate dependent enzyme, partial [Planctomycetaceae bacterium]|nr:pyridoxal-phosphate dependent enzyme [Planctomycetaceae bacterium]